MKLKEFQQYLKEQKISLVFLVFPDPNITYFTQRQFSKAFLLITPARAALYQTKLDNKVKIKEITCRLLSKKWEEQFKKQFKNIKSARIGINKAVLTVKFLEKCKKIWPGAKFIGISEKLAELRAQKTSGEVRKIRYACKITSLAFLALINELPKKKLKTEQDVSFFLEHFFRGKECELAFPSIVAMGKNAAVPHHVTSTAKLKRGFLLLDFGAKYHNYCSDMTRVLFLGTPRNREKERYYL